MATPNDTSPKPPPETATQGSDAAGQAPRLQGGAYEIIRRRLQTHGNELQKRIDQLNVARREVFGAIPTELTGTDRVLTANNCIPRDMIALGPRLLFGFNVRLGLRKDMTPADVFAVYEKQGHSFVEQPLTLVEQPQFLRDFEELYRYYRNTRFSKFFESGPHLYMVFRIGREVTDVKVFKWLVADDGTLSYLDNRSDHEYRYPSQHEFEWTRANRDMQRKGAYPHLSIQDRVFVETSGGTLTIKVEDNTSSGEGIYSEPVLDRDQTLDDAEVLFADVGNLILLKIKPYREDSYRHIVFSEKVQEARRVDAVAGACVLLPEDHGVIFSNGYCLQTGEYKQFESGLRDMLFERRIASPNGEDHLYVFYNRETGTYALLSYNIIEQRVGNPIECHGFCLFASGELAYFKAQEEPSKSHVIQIWQTPYAEALDTAASRKDSLLFKIGNRDIVRCMAGCRTLLGLLQREDSYTNLYLDIVRQATELLDGFFWINDPKAFAMGGALGEIKNAATAAIDEYEKVVQLKAVAARQLAAVETEARTLLNTLRLEPQDRIQDHVAALTGLRGLRGKAIALNDVRYIDGPRVAALDAKLKEQGELQARRCVEFLLGDNAMTPYAERIAALDERVRELSKVAEGEELRKEVEGIGTDLELLIETVSNLAIDDATQRTAIIESISSLFATLNQARSALQNRIRDLAQVEGAAEFGSQLKLLNQAVVNYLEVCDSPTKCEDYLSRIMIQVEELEARFSGFDDYILKLTETREEIYNAFEARRLALVEERNKRADTLQRSAGRILNSVRTRADSLKSVEAIHGYFASDLMIEKLRGIVEQLVALDDPVKADDIQTKLKSIREDAVRQLHDRTELFVGGENVIQFGRHRFSVNVQSLELTLVPRGDTMMLHLTGTDFFEPVTDEAFLATRSVWSQEVVSENDAVYRAEYLAYRMLEACAQPGAAIPIAEAARRTPEQRLADVREFMAPRYSEGYLKGIHDEDAARLLEALLDLHTHIGLLRHDSRARALALVFWSWFEGQPGFAILQARLQGCGASHRLLRRMRRPPELIADLRRDIEAFASGSDVFEARLAPAAADYLFDIVAGGQPHPVSAEAGALCKGFAGQLRRLAAEQAFDESCDRLADHPVERFGLVREWIGTHAASRETAATPEHVDESAALLFARAYDPARVAQQSIVRTVDGLRGSHARIANGSLTLDYNEFTVRLERFAAEAVPRYEQCARLKKELLERHRRGMRLDEFKPHVMTSFVRNRLIDRVYLPLVGDNLAKQIGVVGANTRTDRSGMLLLISPPGYGKTTLMEYVANRLGLVFMKINGPAIGHRVTSLDPAEAPNAAAREELHKLGLALEMGDNVMLYVDDIQHCNPEFLQKFISLCDSQRKIEGVYKGRTRTYDLRGRKVAVVMAGNPYTESGEKFKVPDMLANRADTYNLGDILGDNVEDFELSFLENALTANPALNRLATAGRKDVQTILRMAAGQTQEGVELEGRFANEELSEILAVLRKLLRVREVVLRVNSQYIRSAGQADEFRTEPAFRLQGSYRNMNRLASKVQPVMNEAELETMIFSEYENEAQTLTTGAEANLLKFKQLIGTLEGAEAERWAEIRSTYARNQITRGADDADRVGQAVAQLAHVGQGLHDIRDLLRQELGGAKPTAAAAAAVETGLSDRTLDRIAEIVQRNAVTQGVLRECRDLLGETTTRHDELLERCRRWRDRFLVPLKGQCEGESIANPVDTTDLDAIIDEVDALLRHTAPSAPGKKPAGHPPEKKDKHRPKKDSPAPSE